jgi:hypothetical protein
MGNFRVELAGQAGMVATETNVELMDTPVVRLFSSVAPDRW